MKALHGFRYQKEEKLENKLFFITSPFHILLHVSSRTGGCEGRDEQPILPTSTKQSKWCERKSVNLNMLIPDQVTSIPHPMA
jgi:hypothetical protein